MNYEPKKLASLEVVLKIVERCNINCTYCYMFNKENKDFQERPVYISGHTVSELVLWLDAAIEQYSIEMVRIIFHGGEPLMMKQERFDAICTMLSERIGTKARLRFSIQTNAMLVTNEWIYIFAKHNISVGVSLDGPKHVNDLFRLDHGGLSTYDKTVSGLQLLQHAAGHDLIPAPGVLAVMVPSVSGAEVYRHFVDELHLRNMNFMLPMDSHDQVTDADVIGVENYLYGAVREWASDNNPNITVRMFSDFAKCISSSDQKSARGYVGDNGHMIVVIASNGDISVNDDLKAIDFGQNIGNISNTSLADYLSSPIHGYLETVFKTIVPECSDCVWAGFCRSGAQHQVFNNRYSRKAGFNNKSVYCSGLTKTYNFLCDMLLQNGFNTDSLLNTLEVLSSDVEIGHIADPPERKFNGPVKAVVVHRQQANS